MHEVGRAAEGGRPLVVVFNRSASRAAVQDRAAAAPAQPPAPPAIAARLGGAGETLARTALAAAGESAEAERAEIERLSARDREVRAHERAHAAAGGVHAGAPRYDYEVGPDGGRYAVSGSVAIDTAPIADDPEATLDKMETVRAAALAPAEPSAADRQVAALAESHMATARAQLAALRAEETRAGSPRADGVGALYEIIARPEAAPTMSLSL